MKLSIIILYLFSIPYLISQEKDGQKYETNILVNFQKKLIKDETTGSNEVVIFKDGKIVFHNIENSLKKNDKPITSKTIFPIWSMSKPITVVAMLTLHEKGLIDFDDPVSKYIPSFSNLKCKGINGTYKCEKELKLIHLMNHRSGYKYYDGYYLDAFKSKDLEELVRKIADKPVDFEPGTKYLYGINHSILGRVVEVVSGMSFDKYLNKSIFIPLEMNNTKFYLTDHDRNLFQPLFINNGSIKGFSQEGITSVGDFITYDIKNRAYLGGEGLVSTTKDFINFSQMLLNNGTYKGRKIISSESIKLMTKKHSEGYPVEENSFANTVGFYNGFSIWVMEKPEVAGFDAPKGIYGHGGYQHTEFWIDPENSLFALFMTRALSYKQHREKFMKAVYLVF